MNICRVCRRPSRGAMCARCFEQLYPEAFSRSADTRQARTNERTARDYERAREADEADAPPKHPVYEKERD